MEQVSACILVFWYHSFCRRGSALRHRWPWFIIAATYMRIKLIQWNVRLFMKHRHLFFLVFSWFLLKTYINGPTPWRKIIIFSRSSMRPLVLFWCARNRQKATALMLSSASYACSLWKLADGMALKIERFGSLGKGNGLRTVHKVKAGHLLYKATPLACCVSKKHLATACHNCFTR